MTSREFAIQVATKLQQAGFEGLWAGGCVRDQLLGVEPKDYDVATDASPEKVREIFGYRRSLAIGASFGVITVIGPKSAGNIEVATFRRDAEYSDGRRPDAIEFTNSKEDALRRDFTINGIFFDPVAGKIVDYVHGREDIEKRVIRAIGDPHERIGEDKLRMLRGVRFAATLDFEMDPQTKAAIQQHAAEINVVSEERIGQELVRMLDHENRAIAVRLLWETDLLLQVLPKECRQDFDEEFFAERMEVLKRLQGGLESAVVALLGKTLRNLSSDGLWRAWRLSNEQQKNVHWIYKHWEQLAAAEQSAWSMIQPLLIEPAICCALDLAVAELGSETDGIRYCRMKLAEPMETLNPSPLIDGGDLHKIGLTPGPEFKRILDEVRAAQLDGEISNRDEALEFAKIAVSR